MVHGSYCSRALLLIVTAMTGWCGCNDRKAEGTSGDPRRLIIAIQADAQTLDPHLALDAASMRVLENIHAGLLRYADEGLNVVGDLAESYEVSQDGLEYMFTLRPGVTFHTGRSVTAQDVRRSIERIIAQRIRADHFSAVQQIVTPDDRTVIFHLASPHAPLLTHLAYPMNAVIDAEAPIERSGAGPFRFVRWRRNHALVLERHADDPAWARPHLEQVVFRPMPDGTARSIALRTGQVDLVLDVPANQIELLRRAEGVEVESVPGTFWEYIGLNTRAPPFDDVRVRQAVAWAVDRRQLAELVKFGRAEPLIGGHIPPHHWAHAGLDLYPQRDVPRARELLSKAGHADGLDVMLKIGTSFEYQVRAAQVLKQQLREAGIRITIRALEPTIFFADLGAGDFQMTQVGWVGFVDPDEWMYDIFHSAGRYNQQGYANAELDVLLERGRRTADGDRRVGIYREAQRIVAAEAPMVFLYINEQISARRSNVHGYIVHPTATTRSLRQTRILR